MGNINGKVNLGGVSSNPASQELKGSEGWKAFESFLKKFNFPTFDIPDVFKSKLVDRGDHIWSTRSDLPADSICDMHHFVDELKEKSNVSDYLVIGIAQNGLTETLHYYAVQGSVAIMATMNISSNLGDAERNINMKAPALWHARVLSKVGESKNDINPSKRMVVVVDQLRMEDCSFVVNDVHAPAENGTIAVSSNAGVASLFKVGEYLRR